MFDMKMNYKTIFAVALCVAGMSAQTARADMETWFSENATTVGGALAGDGTTADGAWSNLSEQVSVVGENVVFDADDDQAVAYRPNVEIAGDRASVTLTDVVFEAARDELPPLEAGVQVAVTVTKDESGACVFAIADNGVWAVTAVAADPEASYAVRFDFSYSESGNTVSYAVSTGAEWTVLGADIVNPVAAKVATTEFSGCGSFTAFAGQQEKAATPLVPGSALGPFDTAEAASNAMAKVELMPSAEVAAALGSDEARREYCDMFELDVVPTAEGKFGVEAFLKPPEWTNVVMSAHSATRQIPVAKIAALELGTPTEVTVEGCVPGFYYTIYGGASITNIGMFMSEKCRNVLCEPNKPVTFSEVIKPSDASSFFTIGVLEAPIVYKPSDDVPSPGLVVTGKIVIVRKHEPLH